MASSEVSLIHHQSKLCTLAKDSDADLIVTTEKLVQCALQVWEEGVQRRMPQHAAVMYYTALSLKTRTIR